MKNEIQVDRARAVWKYARREMRGPRRRRLPYYAALPGWLFEEAAP